MKFVLSFLFFLFINKLLAVEPILLTADKREYSVGQNLELLEDKEGKLTFDEIQKKENNHLWQAQPSSIPSFGYSKSVFWVRFKTKTFSHGKFYLEIPYPNLDWIDFYEILQDGKIIHKRSGDYLPFKNRDVNYRNFSFELSSIASADKEYYLRIAGDGSIQIPLVIWEANSFLEKINNEMLGLGIYFGTIFVMLFYNLFIWISIRDRSYLYYVLYLIFTGIFLLNNHGITYQYFWFWSPELYNFQFSIILYLMVIGIMAFTSSFLQLKKNIPFFYKTNLFLIISFTISFIIARIIDFRSAMLTGIIFGLTALCQCLITGILMTLRGYRPAIFYLMAWSVFLIGSILLSFKTLSFISNNFFTDYAMTIGSGLEVVLLSLALADKINDLKKENEISQAKLLANQNIAIENLEKLAKEKTNKLDQTLKIIQKDLAMAQKIQKNLLKSETDFSNVLTITPYYLPMAEVGGDIYQINQVNDWTYRIFLADATGHGVQAAMITMAIQGVYDNIKNFDVDVAQVMGIFNSEYLYRYKSLNSFVTAIIIEIDTKKEILNYVSAGHPPALLLQNGKIIKMGYTGRMIGISQNNSYKLHSFPFTKKDRLYIFTDGAFEQFNEKKEEFGEDTLISLLSQNQHLPLNQTIQIVLDRLIEFLDGSEAQDDITILGVQYNSQDLAPLIQNQ